MHIRRAEKSDYREMHRLRMSVRENRLRNPASVTLEDYDRIISAGGCAWVCERDGAIAGFAVADLAATRVWALFVAPEQEGLGIGRTLHGEMMAWLFSQGAERVWLVTDAGTRAQRFYETAGWRLIGTQPDGEVRYELRDADWKARW